MPYINEQCIQEAENEYVCWIDIMGTKNKMTNSVRTCAVFICRFHAAILECQDSEINITTYPVMDGVYVTSKDKGDILKFISKVFSALAREFVSTGDNNHRFMIKAALSYGPIIHGKTIGNTVNRVFEQYPAYRDSILLGMPMIQAFANEKNAPSFGIFVHESARAFAPAGERPFAHRWWKWFLNLQGWTKANTQALNEAVLDYFDFAVQHTIDLDYPTDRVEEHKRMLVEYLAEE